MLSFHVITSTAIAKPFQIFTIIVSKHQKIDIWKQQKLSLNIKGIPLNINVLIKMLELAKAMERNIPVLLMWRRPYGCIYIAHLVHLLICNFFAFSQEFFGILDFHIPRVHFTPVSNLWKNATRFKQNYWITDSMLQLLNECSAVNRENVGRK